VTRTGPVYLLLEEDLYETRFGDGYYPYFRKAFWAAGDAEAFIRGGEPVDRISCLHHPDAGPCFEQRLEAPHVGSALHTVPARLELVGGEPVLTWSHRVEEVPDLRRLILESLAEAPP
jgi:hypothetical protein